MSEGGINLYNEGYCYYTGEEGYPLNYRKALECFQKAADLGVSPAMNYLGMMYEDGEIVSQDWKLAVDWYYKALQADSKNVYAAYNLGRMYYNGQGVRTDMGKAYDFFNAVVNLGRGNTHSVYPQSCYMTGCILVEHFENYKAALPYFADAAKYGNIPEAWYNLGWLAEKGIVSVQQSGYSTSDTRAKYDGAARNYYENAAQLEYVPAMDAMGRLYIKYNKLKEARMWLEKAASVGYEPAKKRLRMLNVGQSGSLWDLFK